MANGKFTIRHKRDKYENFSSFDSDDVGAECTEATNAQNLGLRMSAETSAQFKAIQPGGYVVSGMWEYFVKWRG